MTKILPTTEPPTQTLARVLLLFIGGAMMLIGIGLLIILGAIIAGLMMG